jgi:aminoglycoside 6'-N-acetyltransferase I
MEIEYRRLGRDDAGVLARVAAEVFDEPIQPELAAAYLAEPTHLMIVALLDGQVVGQVVATLHRHPDKAPDLYVDEIGVAPAFQRRGIARRLMEEAFAWGRGLGCAGAWLATEPDNTAALALYRALGEAPQPIVMFEYDL